MLTEKEQLDTLTTVGIELNQINDLDILMEQVLTKARYCVNADAGSIYIREGGKLNFTYTQNDTLQRRLHLNEKLIYSTFSIPIDTKSLAGYVAATGRALNIPNVYQLAPDVPYAFSNKFDEASGYTTRSVFTLPLKNMKGDILGILQIINATDDRGNVIPFSPQSEKIMLHFASIAAVALERAQLTRSIIMRMIKMAEMRDPKETGTHVNRVAGYSIELYEKWAKRRKLPLHEIDKTRDILRMAAMLHDVGKVGIADAILKKPARLDNEEYEIMKQHTVFGARLFMDQNSDFDEAAGQVALNHHEWWDGSSRGYPGHIDVATGTPNQLSPESTDQAKPKKGDEIPLYGRIVALADVFDALASIRSYKEAWDDNRILSILKEEAGTHFDPELVELFIESFEVIKSIRERYADEKT